MAREVAGEHDRLLLGADQAHTAGGGAQADRLADPDAGVLDPGDELGAGLDGLADARHHRGGLPRLAQARRADLADGGLGVHRRAGRDAVAERVRVGVLEDLRQALLDHGWIYVEKRTYGPNEDGIYRLRRRYSAYADKTNYFVPIPAHEAPKFGDEVDHTLKVTPVGAAAIARAARRWGLIDDDATAIEEDAA